MGSVSVIAVISEEEEEGITRPFVLLRQEDEETEIERI